MNLSETPPLHLPTFCLALLSLPRPATPPLPPPPPSSPLPSVKGGAKDCTRLGPSLIIISEQHPYPSLSPLSTFAFSALSLPPPASMLNNTRAAPYNHIWSALPLLLSIVHFQTKRCFFLPPGPRPSAISFPYPLSNPSRLFWFKCPLLFPVIKANKIKPGALLYVLPSCFRFLEMQGPKPYQSS